MFVFENRCRQCGKTIRTSFPCASGLLLCHSCTGQNPEPTLRPEDAIEQLRNINSDCPEEIAFAHESIANSLLYSHDDVILTENRRHALHEALHEARSAIDIWTGLDTLDCDTHLARLRELETALVQILET